MYENYLDAGLFNPAIAKPQNVSGNLKPTKKSSLSTKNNVQTHRKDKNVKPQ